MDAVRYIVECDRMCRSFPNCRDCPIRARLSFSSCEQFKIDNPEETVAIVEKWSAEHPKKTRLQDFMEKHPGAEVNADSLPPFMPSWLGYCGKSCYSCERQPTAKDCWDLPVEE